MNAAPLVAILLTACAPTPRPEPTIVTREVRVPVPVPCTPQLSQRPAYPATPEAIAAAPDIYARVQLVVSELLLRRAYEAEQAAALEACGK